MLVNKSQIAKSSLKVVIVLCLFVCFLKSGCTCFYSQRSKSMGETH